MQNLTRTADYLAASVQAMGFILMSQTGGKGLPLVAFRLDPAKKHAFDEFAIAHALRERGWQVPAYAFPANRTDLDALRIVVRRGFTHDLADLLVADLERQLPRLQRQPEPVHDAWSGTGFAH